MLCCGALQPVDEPESRRDQKCSRLPWSMLSFHTSHDSMMVSNMVSDFDAFCSPSMIGLDVAIVPMPAWCAGSSP